LGLIAIPLLLIAAESGRLIDALEQACADNALAKTGVGRWPCPTAAPSDPYSWLGFGVGDRHRLRLGDRLLLLAYNRNPSRVNDRFRSDRTLIAVSV